MAEAIDNLLLRMDVFSFNESCMCRAAVHSSGDRPAQMIYTA
jgi:hypothetical protein